MQWKKSIKAPKWAKSGSALSVLAWRLDLKIDMFEIKGIIRTEVFFTVEGAENKVKHFKSAFAEMVKNYKG